MASRFLWEWAPERRLWNWPYATRRKSSREQRFTGVSEGQDTLVSWLEDRGLGPEETCVCTEASDDFEKAVANRLYEEGYRVSARVQGESRDTHQANCNLRRPILPTDP